MKRRAAIIQDGIVVNTIVLPDDWTGEKPGDWVLPEGCSCVFDDVASKGDTYIRDKLVRKNSPRQSAVDIPKLINRVKTVELDRRMNNEISKADQLEIMAGGRDKTDTLRKLASLRTEFNTAVAKLEKVDPNDRKTIQTILDSIRSPENRTGE